MRILRCWRSCKLSAFAERFDEVVVVSGDGIFASVSLRNLELTA